MHAASSRKTLARRAFGGLITFQVVLALLLFVPAGTWHYWQAWMYWLVFTASVLLVTLYFLRFDPALVERRLHAGPTAERRPSQKVIQTAAALLLCALFATPALERRLHHAPLPAALSLAADLLVVVSFALIFRVFRENSFASTVVEVTPEQKVISSGPYARVRHPLYSASFLLFLATPPALGHLWGLVPAALLCGVIVVRLLDEERLLVQELPGYEEYRRKVPDRLIPGIW
jgi:protein-S-isoprenylcysteine O-methyltransferase Ste14